MKSQFSRRSFLKTTAATAGMAGLGDLAFLSQLQPVSAAEARLDPKTVRVNPDIEPIVRLLEDTPRERLLDEVAARIRRGLSYREVLAALLLAGVRNIQPRPVGFKFHAVLVVNSAHLASLASPDNDRWLPIFWALDEFKKSQARDVNEGDWSMTAVEESKVPPADQARTAFTRAMDRWDVEAADAAVVGLVRSAAPEEVFKIFCRYGARDFRDIGHKAIYVSNSWRTLQAIGWQHAEPVMRSLAYALLAHEGDNPSTRDATADRAGRRNLELLGKFPENWKGGKVSADATREMMETLREGSPEESSDKVLALLNDGVAPQSIWDATFDCASELLMRRPGIVSLHAVTSTNAMHFAFRTADDENARRFLLLQNAAFVALFRGDPAKLKKAQLDDLVPEPPKAKGKEAVAEIFADVSRDRFLAARKVRGYLQANGPVRDLIHAARRLIFLKGTNAHDYKFSSAVLEDYEQISAAWRDRYLAASLYNLRGSGDRDNGLVERTRAAFEA